MDTFFNASKNKTRVLILTSNSVIAQFFLNILHFNEKDFDFLLEDGNHQNAGNDFVILETSNLEKATLFQPNIALITQDVKPDEISAVLRNIVAGGVLIHPNAFQEAAEESGNFFRKLEFSLADFQKSQDHFILSTSLGPIPLSSEEESLAANMEGVKLLAQQFGVMEEEFYEAVTEFK